MMVRERWLIKRGDDGKVRLNLLGRLYFSRLNPRWWFSE